ncbi:hypothetical protein CRENBAI_013194 [Crenichthys baileyi]|uniref:Uncharacterized protein n=1 Tax=Crenichthys baileyi TaxID=28760 RepID=A0AAV9RTM7_9TELE
MVNPLPPCKDSARGANPSQGAPVGLDGRVLEDNSSLSVARRLDDSSMSSLLDKPRYRSAFLSATALFARAASCQEVQRRCECQRSPAGGGGDDICLTPSTKRKSHFVLRWLR